MKTSLVPCLLAVFCLSLAPTYLLAQAGTPSTPPADVPLRPVPPADPAQPAPPTYELTAKWNERWSVSVLSVPFKNESEKPLKILGVQATRGIFIGDFPSTIGPGREDTIAFVHEGADNTDGDLDLIRVLTDQGIKEILVKIAREAAVKFDVRELAWTVGDAAEAKSATITVTAGTVTPQKARVTGGHQAVLESAGAHTWRVKVTPASTAKSGKFAVFVDFDQPLPGTAPVILGVIQPKE